MLERALKDNSKVVITKDGINPSIIIGDLPIESGHEKGPVIMAPAVGKGRDRIVVSGESEIASC